MAQYTNQKFMPTSLNRILILFIFSILYKKNKMAQMTTMQFSKSSAPLKLRQHV